jgi:hypothetical protein
LGTAKCKRIQPKDVEAGEEVIGNKKSVVLDGKHRIGVRAIEVTGLACAKLAAA